MASIVIRLVAIAFICGVLAFSQTAQFPSAKATDANVLVAGFRAQSTLSGAMNVSQTEFNVATSSNFANNMAVVIDDEAIFCTTFSGLTFSGCTRGFDSTTAATHRNQSTVSGYFVPCHHNCLSVEIKAMETYLVDTAFSALPQNALLWCTDCTESVTCAGGGSGAWARCENGTCQCFWGATSVGGGWIPIEIGRDLTSTDNTEFTLSATGCKRFLWVIRGLTLTAASTLLELQVATGGAILTANYEWATAGGASFTVESSGATADAEMQLTMSPYLDDTTNHAYNGRVILNDPFGSTAYKQFQWVGGMGVFTNWWGGGSYTGGTAALSKVKFTYDTISGGGSSSADGGEIDFFGLDCD